MTSSPVTKLAIGFTVAAMLVIGAFLASFLGMLAVLAALSAMPTSWRRSRRPESLPTYPTPVTQEESAIRAEASQRLLKQRADREAKDRERMAWLNDTDEARLNRLFADVPQAVRETEGI